MSAVNDACDQIVKLLASCNWTVTGWRIECAIADGRLVWQAVDKLCRAGLVAYGRVPGEYDGEKAWELDATEELRGLLAAGRWPNWEEESEP